jgi:hypothetical protein
MLPGIGGLAGAYGKFAKAALARAATDDEADLKDIARAGIFAAAPTIISEGAGSMASNYASKGTDSGMFKFLKGVEKAGAPEGFMGNAKMIGAQGATDAAIKASRIKRRCISKIQCRNGSARYQ